MIGDKIKQRRNELNLKQSLLIINHFFDFFNPK